MNNDLTSWSRDALEAEVIRLRGQVENWRSSMGNAVNLLPQSGNKLIRTPEDSHDVSRA